MRFIKVLYDDNSDYIVEIIKEISNTTLVEYYNIDVNREKRKAIPIMVRHGTKNVPLIVFEDENLQEVSAIWSEQNPDWKVELIKKMNE